MKTAIIGATGYGGIELIRLLSSHPDVTQIAVFSSSQQGVKMTDSYPHISERFFESLQDISIEALQGFDVIFLSTPPGVSAEWSSRLSNTAKVIDLSGDLRINDPAAYEKWYGRGTASQDVLDKAVYGLTEWNRERIKKAQVIANPGCYPTAVLLGMIPLVKAGAVDPSTIIIDAKSGTTGAGRSASDMTHYSEMNDNLKIYKVNEHKHIPEIEQELAGFLNKEITITLSTHLVPMTRGMMATMYATVPEEFDEEKIKEIMESTYRDTPFVRVRPHKQMPSTREVNASNFCDIGWVYDKRTNRLTVVSVIDNLVKGASGQAVQNMNIMFGLKETAGLNGLPVFP